MSMGLTSLTAEEVINSLDEKKLKLIIKTFGEETDANFGRYNYTYYVQRIGHHSTLNGYNFIPQTTMGPDGLVAGTKNSRRIFYRVIGCGFGPNPDYIVPIQGYFSAGGDDPAGVTNANLDARSLKSEGYFKP